MYYVEVGVEAFHAFSNLPQVLLRLAETYPHILEKVQNLNLYLSYPGSAAVEMVAEKCRKSHEGSHKRHSSWPQWSPVVECTPTTTLKHLLYS